MNMLDLIYKKRNGEILQKEEIAFFVNAVTNNSVPDYQIAAFLMTIFFQKMNKHETANLTEAMMNSGDIVSLTEIDGVKVDKHSTGGVGDKTTIALGPMVAACGVPVAKMSGRGLGHTGGTIDKLEAFTGIKTDMSIDDFIQRVNDIQLAVAGQTSNLAPADKKLYALRDVTGTVDNISLIASSVMSKKLASGADAIVLDVKYGSGAFMKTSADAEELAALMVSIGEKLNRKIVALVTDMDQPLGYAIGNTLEVIEAINVLKGKGPEDVTRLCIELGSQILVLAEKTDSLSNARNMMKETINNGSALNKLKQFVQLQNGDTRLIDSEESFWSTKFQYNVIAKESGFVYSINAEYIGKAALALGAGRTTKDSVIDLNVGIILNKKRGEYVNANESIAIIYSNDNGLISEAEKWIEQAYHFNQDKPEEVEMIQKIIK
ncbi:pyrimidine-nucleoside phosphorylase [Tindallia californiensis]|uniref:Pyrimidine-nucleoside phosphorylase n=1 Tax=Tindallia californiensis TaxID=159292 RepID=A0A1H3NKS3_9FIRM|nr:pyrimidine-nucleoside phosphorylase [Tindallia californiensis]SDY89482.1 thymidine phosphorylase [Tindallia californiensis]